MSTMFMDVNEEVGRQIVMDVPGTAGPNDAERHREPVRRWRDDPLFSTGVYSQQSCLKSFRRSDSQLQQPALDWRRNATRKSDAHNTCAYDVIVLLGGPQRRARFAMINKCRRRYAGLEWMPSIWTIQFLAPGWNFPKPSSPTSVRFCVHERDPDVRPFSEHFRDRKVKDGYRHASSSRPQSPLRQSSWQLSPLAAEAALTLETDGRTPDDNRPPCRAAPRASGGHFRHLHRIRGGTTGTVREP